MNSLVSPEQARLDLPPDSVEPEPMAEAPPQDTAADILLVDDREDKLLALEVILKPLQQNVVKARSGKDALRKLLQQNFAVILLDVSMPEMDGFETASLIRARPTSEHTPIIFITAFGNSDTRISRGYSIGAADYMVTPLVPEILRAKVTVFVELYRKTQLIRQQSEQLQHLNRELERRVTALTDINRELEAFAYSISHDLRTPLRAMSSFARALLEPGAGNLSEQGTDFAQRIIRSATYMDELLQDLLTYSRLAREEISLTHVDLDEPVRNLLGMLQDEVARQKGRLEVALPLGNAKVHLPTLHQILTNLVGNGLKFAAPNRSPLVRIYTSREGRFLRLHVEDNGIGIKREFQDKIFGLFERLPDAQTYPGTGVGLALVRKGAERMGGRAGVESKLGQGSRFWVDLPAAASSEHAQ